MTVRTLLNSLDSNELTEWIGFCKLEQEGGDNPEVESTKVLEAQLKSLPLTVNQKKTTKHNQKMRENAKIGGKA